ncbi:MAG: hypothetical protein ACRCT6_08125 [Notoacmeibacter sp.]
MRFARTKSGIVACAAFLLAGHSFALSELEPFGPPVPPALSTPSPAAETLVPQGVEVVREPLAPVETVPLPAPIPEVPSAAPNTDITGPASTEQTNVVPALNDLLLLPEPARRFRQLLIEAAETGDIEKLRPLLGAGSTATQLAVTEFEGDPIDYLKGQAGDAGGQEILAIMLDLLDTKFVHTDIGTSEELFVWPYFVERQLDQLTMPERVDLFRIVTAGDYEDMKVFGAYNFYRIGISPAGEFVFFVSGD